MLCVTEYMCERMEYEYNSWNWHQRKWELIRAQSANEIDCYYDFRNSVFRPHVRVHIPFGIREQNDSQSCFFSLLFVCFSYMYLTQSIYLCERTHFCYSNDYLYLWVPLCVLITAKLYTKWNIITMCISL